MQVCDHKVIFEGTAGACSNTISFTALTYLRSGELLATARIGSGKDTADGTIGIWRSSDTGIIGQIACPVVLSDSHVVMLYVRRDEKRQILAHESFDGGKTWNANSEICLYNQAGNDNESANLFDAMNQWSYGHPYGIKISNAEIAAVYYAGKGSHTSLHFCKIRL